MAFEFDHLFICANVDANEANLLVSSGLVEGSSNIHVGQGTANRRFFFHNAMLEFLWVHNREEATSEKIRPTRLWERWENRNGDVCPFGICLRPTAEAMNAVAFSSWAYYPPYLLETMSIAVGNNSDVLAEPMLFQISFGKRPDQFPVDRAQPLNHAIGVREVTRVTLITPVATRPSPELQAVINTHQVTLQQGDQYCVEFGFDGERQGQKIDFRPGIPFVISW